MPSFQSHAHSFKFGICNSFVCHSYENCRVRANSSHFGTQESRHRGKTLRVRIEFEAVFHTAIMWINEGWAGEHVGKEYAFMLDITRLLSCGKSNTIAGCVDNAFNGNILPRGRSSDWAHDAGIYRPVQLLITPKTFVERVDLEAVPDLHSKLP